MTYITVLTTLNFLVHMHPCHKTWECNTPARSGRDWCFPTHSVTVCSVGVMCKPWGNPKGKQWIILNEKWELCICILFASKYWTERGNTVQGSPAASPFCIYCGHTRILYTGKENGSAESFLLLLLFPHIIDSCFFRKEGMRLEISIKNFPVPLHSNPPIEHFWKPSLFLYTFGAVHLNFQDSPCSVCDVH